MALPNKCNGIHGKCKVFLNNVNLVFESLPTRYLPDQSRIGPDAVARASVPIASPTITFKLSALTVRETVKLGQSFSIHDTGLHPIGPPMGHDLRLY